MQTTEIPVVVAHFNNKPNYLKFALESAAKFNKTVVLIGDKTNEDLWINHWDTTIVEFDKYEKFLKYYTQMTRFSKDYENGYWKRMFMVEKWMKESGYKEVFLLDSDVMTFANYSKEIAAILSNNYMVALSAPEDQSNFRWANSCHCSYWTLAALEDFTNFCIEAYINKNIRDKIDAKWQWHLDNNKPGGVSEMTLLYLWSQVNSQVANTAKVINDMAIDHAIKLSNNYFKNEYKMKFGVKKLIFKDGIPYGYNQILNKEIKFLCLHCQGNAKGSMKFLYYKQLRHLYYLPPLVATIRYKTSLLIKKITNNR